MNEQLLDSIPVVLIFVLFAIVTLLCYEVGFRVGRWWQDREPGEQEGPTDMLVGSLLALMAFLLAVTMGMAADRFDARRGLVLDQANAIGAVYMQSDYLNEPAAGQLKELLREYLPLRIAIADKAQLQANIERSVELQPRMWTLVKEGAHSDKVQADLVSALGDSLTQLVAIGESRGVARNYSRVPETVLLVLLAGSALSLGMVGYSAGLKRRRSVLSAVVLVVALGVVLTIVIDLDRPNEGFVTVSQQALLDVQTWIGLPSP